MQLRLFAKVFWLLTFLTLSRSEDAEFLYKSTKICARHKSYLCLSYDKKNSMIVLGSKGKLNFEIETVERINMQLNRVYTYAVDKATRKKVKSCLVRKALEDGSYGVDLAPCDTDDKELVLAVEIPHMDISKLTTDEFVLREVSYLDDGNSISSPYCLSASHKEGGELTSVLAKRQLKRHSPVILTNCGAEEEAYGQEFRAKGFRKSLSQRLVAKEEAEVKAEIGMFCLTEKPDLCLGVSLTGGEELDANKLLQVKNFTKNEAKGIHDLKMRWYHDLQNKRIASASDMNLCLEAIYSAPIGENRAGRPQFDDVVHLGNCDTNMVEKNTALTGLTKSEKFYTQDIVTPSGSYMELRTDIPDGSGTKCVSIVKCVRHDHGHCTPYNSVPVFDSSLLSQGAHARLKDCNSEEMVSQRFYYVSDTEITVPPTRYPTVKPTPEPTTLPPVTEPPVPVPTPKPTIFVEPVAPTVGTETDEGTTEDRSGVSTGSPGLLAGLAFVGVLCLLIILVALAYYFKHRSEFTGLPEEDENFIARV